MSRSTPIDTGDLLEKLGQAVAEWEDSPYYLQEEELFDLERFLLDHQAHDFKIELERTYGKPLNKEFWTSSLAYQSRLGPVKWLEPSLHEALRRLAAKGAPPLVIVPVSFVSDHIETLYELDIQYRGIAQELGFPFFKRAPALNTRPDFIKVLADLVLRAILPS